MADKKKTEVVEKVSLQSRIKDTGMQFHSLVTKMDVDPPVLEKLITKVGTHNGLRNAILLSLLKSWQFYAVSGTLLGLSFLLGLLHGS